MRVEQRGYRGGRTATAVFVAVLPSLFFTGPSPSEAGPHRVGPAVETATPVPAWFRESLERLTKDGGRWIADNTRYLSDTERFPAYGTQFTRGLTAATAGGRLFGIHPDGREENFWEFYIYWDPLAGKAVFMQTHVAGGFGIGELRVPRPGVEELEQTFWWGDSSINRSLHREQVGEHERRSESFEFSGNTWVARRQYIWKRAR